MFRRYKFVWPVCFLMLFFFSSCEKIYDKLGWYQGTPDDFVYTFLTGKCLNSGKLSYYLPDGLGQQIEDSFFVFRFTMDWTSTKKDPLKRYMWGANYWRKIPSDELFDQFGETAKNVRSEYDAVYQDFKESYFALYGNWRFSIGTVLYCGGLSLTADKDFAGYKAGTNLAPIVTTHPRYGRIQTATKEESSCLSRMNAKSNAGGFLDIPMDYICMTEEDVCFSIPVSDYEITKKQVNFKLEIPVKAVKYLHWLNDKISDPDAPVPYDEITLCCQFTANYCLE